MNFPLITIRNFTLFVVVICLFVGSLFWFQTLGNHTLASSTLRKHTDFGTNPGNLEMFSYVPNRVNRAVPLVIVLHGCGQYVADIDQESGWLPYAKKEHFALLFAQQKRTNNLLRCFNWFKPEDATRDQGEALSIRQMIDTLQNQYDINSQQIFITGFSAGAAMAVAMLSTYPEVFEGGAIIAGIPYGCANGLYSAFRCQGGKVDFSPTVWGKT